MSVNTANRKCDVVVDGNMGRWYDGKVGVTQHCRSPEAAEGADAALSIYDLIWGYRIRDSDTQCCNRSVATSDDRSVAVGPQTVSLLTSGRAVV